MVGPGGLEPPRAYAHWILSPMRLPIPPRPQMEVPVRFELTVTELQSVALPTWLRNQIKAAPLGANPLYNT